MAANQRQRFIAVGGVVVIVLICMLTFFSASGNATVMTVEQASQTDAIGKKVEVTGNVVDNSFEISGDILTFRISDPDQPETDLQVRYDKGVSATFGNGVTAICTGSIAEDGALVCSELVTKCPSKYETATDALTVSRLRGYGDAILDKTVKVQGILEPGSLKDASADVRFSILDADGDADAGSGAADAYDDSDAPDATSLQVRYQGALSEEVGDGDSVVLLGSLGSDGVFTATEVALEG